MRPFAQSTCVENQSQHLYLPIHQHLFSVWGMNLGEKIKHYREGLGWTLEHLSDLSGVEKGTISALEVRKSKRSEFAGKLAAAFGLSINQLLSERDFLRDLQAGYRQAEDDAEPATLSADDQQILSAADFMPPDRLANMIEQVKQARNSKAALLAKLLEIQREGEAIEPPLKPPAPEVSEPPKRTHGKPYKLPEPGIARPHAGHHKKRVA